MKDPFHTTKKLTKRIAELKAYRFQKVRPYKVVEKRR